MPDGRERRQHAQGPGHLDRALPTGQAERAEGAHGDPVGLQVAASDRSQPGGDLGALRRSELESVPVAAGTGGWLPGIAYDAADRTTPRVA